MCERYVVPERADVEREFRLAHSWWRFVPSYNVASGRNVPVVRQHEGESEGVMLRWGLVPEWAEGDPARGCASHVPAAEVASAAITRDAWAKGRRCILPLSGFYAWQLMPARYRQPYFVHLAGRTVFGIAALWDRTVAEDEDDVVESCAILVTDEATRTPAILRREDYDLWLSAPAARAKALLRAYPETELLAHPISPRVNSLKYDDPQLIEPVADTAGRTRQEVALVHAA